jgi:biotin operon repressor
MNKQNVYAYLEGNCRGRRRSITSRRLEQKLNLSGNEIRKQVNALRREGLPIASSGDGYFYAENAAEVYATIRSLKKMRRGLDSAIEGLEMALARFGDES